MQVLHQDGHKAFVGAPFASSGRLRVQQRLPDSSIQASSYPESAVGSRLTLTIRGITT